MPIAARMRTPLASLLILGCAQADERTAADPLQSIFSVTAAVRTQPLPNYDEAPRTPDADDPAIWLDGDGEGLVITTLKDGGLAVYDLAGQLVQALSPYHRPAIAAEDPPATGIQPEDGTEPCPESESGERYGRYNNVDVQYDPRFLKSLSFCGDYALTAWDEL